MGAAGGGKRGERAVGSEYDGGGGLSFALSPPVIPAKAGIQMAAIKPGRAKPSPPEAGGSPLP